MDGSLEQVDLSATSRDTIGWRVNLLARLMAQALKQHTAPHGVLPGHYPALAALWSEDGLTQKELVDRVNIEQSTLAHTLKRMEREGLIDRRSCPEDGRLVRHWLTDKGRDVRGVVVEGIKQVNARSVQGIPPEDVAGFVTALEAMIANLKQETGTR